LGEWDSLFSSKEYLCTFLFFSFLNVSHFAAFNNLEILKSVDVEKSVTWVAFKPFAQNTVTWTEQYGVYASTTEIQQGAKRGVMYQSYTVSGDPLDFVLEIPFKIIRPHTNFIIEYQIKHSKTKSSGDFTLVTLQK
jgi:hypothetical protein